MLCSHCNKNEAVKTYDMAKEGKKGKKYYCLTCYENLFLSADEETMGVSVCPYCGTSVEEFQKTKLVGCAHCYRTLSSAITPSVIGMQGRNGHRGKTPPVEDGTAPQDEEAVAKIRFQRQCRELELVIEKLAGEDNYEDAKEYAAKLSRMKSKSRVEEEFVWRKKRTPLKKS